MITNTFTVGKHNFPIEGRDLANPTPAENAFLKTLTALDDFVQARLRVDSDAQLSPFGRDVKLVPLVNGVWQTILRSTETIENERLALVKKEADLFGVPKIATPYEIAMDRERRDWFKSLSSSDLHKFLTSLRAGEKHAEIVNSLMRSPVPMLLDRNLQVVEEIHQENRKAQFPDIWVEIEAGNASIEWSQRAMGHIVGFAYITTHKSSNDICLFALAQGFDLAAETLYGKESVAHAKRTGKIKTIEQVAALN